MATELWFRNPNLYVRECVEAGVENITWDAGILKKFALDPVRFMDLHYGLNPWRAIIMHEYGAIEIRNGGDLRRPSAVYPIWEYGEDWPILEEMVANPLGSNADATSDISIPLEYRPVAGQEHRVVVIRPPLASHGIGKTFFRALVQLQEEYPDCKIHVHGVYSYRVLFGLGFQSVDFDPRTDAQKGNVVLPMGTKMPFERAAELPHWVNLLGFRPVQLKIPRNRCIYNIKSAMWAAEHFRDDMRFQWKGYGHIDPDDPLGRRKRKKLTDGRIMTRNRPVLSEGDKYICDTCSLQKTCKLFRVGAICAVPDSEPAKLAEMLNTRDAESIIDGLGTLLAAQSRRFEQGLMEESADGELDPEVTRIFKTLFEGGVKLAKLVDPSLRASPTLNFKFQHNQATITAASPQQLMAAVVDELVQRGIPRSEITPDMVRGILERPEEARERAIEAAAELKAG